MAPMDLGVFFCLRALGMSAVDAGFPSVSPVRACTPPWREGGGSFPELLMVWREKTGPMYYSLCPKSHLLIVVQRQSRFEP